MGRSRTLVATYGLLPRMEARPWADGKTVSYRYHPMGGKPIALGTDRKVAIRKVLEMNEVPKAVGTLEWVWQQYMDSTRWRNYTPGTRADYELAWKQIAQVLGEMPISTIDSNIVARYVHVQRANSPRRADIEKALLSRLFGHAILLGVCSVNGTHGVEPHGNSARTNAPDPTVVKRLLDWLDTQSPQRRIIGLAAEYASLTGSRRIEFLHLTWERVSLDAKVIETKRAKQRGAKKGEVYEHVEITPPLQNVLKRLKRISREHPSHSVYVFPNQDGGPYTDSAFKTLWNRCMTKAVAEAILRTEQKFTFHDLRAYYTTLHKAEQGALPDLHANPETTARVYDRNKIVKRRALALDQPS